MADNDDVEPAVLQPRATTTYIPYIGRFRIVGDLELKEMMFLLFAFVSLIGASIITGVRIQVTAGYDPEMNFAILLLVNLVIILYYVIHGVFFERPFELLVSVVGTVIVMSYSILEFALHGKYDTGYNYNLKLGRLIAVCALGPVDIVLGCIIAWKFYTSRSLIYRTVGGNAALQGMCQVMFIFTAFLKFDLQLVVSLLILILVGHNAEVSTAHKLVIGLGTPYSFMWVALGFILLRYEDRRMAYVFWLMSVAEPCYIIFLFVRTAKSLSNSKPHVKSRYDSLQMLQYCTIVAGALGLLIRAIVLALSVFVVKSFGKGLKEKVYSNDSDDTRRLPSNDDSYADYESTRTHSEHE